MTPIGYEFHVDCFTVPMPDGFLGALSELGLRSDETIGGPFLPLDMWSLKSSNKDLFMNMLNRAKTVLQQFSQGFWYAEAEAVVGDYTFTSGKPFDTNVPLGALVRLTPQLATSSRQLSEFHLTFRDKEVDPSLVGRLVMDLDAYPARFKKSGGDNLVLTVQGDIRHIAAIVPILIRYIERCGGYSTADIKHENVIWFQRSNKAVQLPPRIRTVLIS